MGEPLLAHQVVGLEGCLEVANVDANGAPHEQVLGSLGDLAIDSQEVGLLEGFESEEVVCEIAGVIDDFVNALIVVFDDGVDFWGEEGSWAALLVMVVVELASDGKDAAVGRVVQGLDRHAVGELGVVGMDDGQIGASFGGQLSNLSSCHSFRRTKVSQNCQI